MKRSKQTPVFTISEEFNGLSPRRYTVSSYRENTSGSWGKVTCLPLNRSAFRIAMSIEGMTEKIGVYGHNFFNKRVRDENTED